MIRERTMGAVYIRFSSGAELLAFSFIDIIATEVLVRILDLLYTILDCNTY